MFTVMESVAKAAGGIITRRLTASAPRVLMYHRFGDRAVPRRMGRATFEEHLRYLTRHFRIRPLQEVVEALKGEREVEPFTAVLTIDDGYDDFVDHAYPLLQRFEVPATIFVATDFVDRRRWLWFDAIHYLLHTTASPRLDVWIGSARLERDLSSSEQRDRAWSAVGTLCMSMDSAQRASVIERLQDVLDLGLPEKPTADYSPMTWEAARRFDPDLIEVGAHTCTHPVLSHCTEAEILYELQESKRLIELRLQRPVAAFAYPHGEPADYDDRAVAAARTVGYTCATVAHGGPVRLGADPYRLERLSPTTDATQFRSTLDGLELLANRYRAWRHAATF